MTHGLKQKNFVFSSFATFHIQELMKKKILILWMGVIVVKFFGKFDLIHDDHDDDGTNWKFSLTSCY